MNKVNTESVPATRPLRILRVDSSGRYQGSSTRSLANAVVNQLQRNHARAEITSRDVARGLPFVDEAWITANFTPEEERDDAAREQLAYSDSLVDELKHADVIVIGVPMYNFGIPASLKAWIDMISRARLTFRYTEQGPVGLLHDKKAYLVVASGGVAVDSPMDFATPYLRHALAFLGITDVTVITAEQQNARGEQAIESARAQIVAKVSSLPTRVAA